MALFSGASQGQQPHSIQCPRRRLTDSPKVGASDEVDCGITERVRIHRGAIVPAQCEHQNTSLWQLTHCFPFALNLVSRRAKTRVGATSKVTIDVVFILGMIKRAVDWVDPVSALKSGF